MSDSLVLVDRLGTNLAFLEPDVLAVTRRWCGGASVAATLDVRDPKAARVVPAATALQFWLDDVIRFHGQVGEPLTSDEANVLVVAGDPWDVLMSRKLQVDETYVGADGGPIADPWSIINTENTRGPGSIGATGIRRGGYVALNNGPNSITFTAGTTRGDALLQFSQLDSSGFGFTLDAVAGVPGILAEFNVFALGAAARGVLPDVKLEYGAGTLDNCDGFTEELARPRNRVIARGQSLPDGTRPQAVAADAASQATYGLWEYEVSVDSIDTTILAARALAELRPDPIATYTLKPTPDAPFLFRDFDAGNVVSLTIRHGRVDVTGTARVDECTIKRDSADWRIDSMTLSSPLVQRIARADLLYGLIGSMDGRLGVLERAGVVGS